MSSSFQQQNLPSVLIWRAENVGLKDIDRAPNAKDVGVARSDITSNLSEVVDNGEEAQLKYSITKASAARKGGSSLIDPLKGIDPRTDNAPNVYGDFSSLDISDCNSEGRISSPDENWDDQVLRAQHLEGFAEFLPYDELGALMVKKRVKKYLEICKIPSRYPESNLQEITDAILDRHKVPDPRDSPGQPKRLRRPMRETCRRKIFAILASIDKADDIELFIEHGIYDCHLPLAIDFTKQVVSREIGGVLEPLPIRHWTRRVLDTFNYYQWRVTAPFFDMADHKCPHLKLRSETILPFGRDSGTAKAYGGSGEVEKIVVHPAHHNYPHEKDDNQHLYFARKRLQKGTLSQQDYEKRFWNERNNLLRVRKNPNVITMLASYEKDGEYSFLFPWAHGGDLTAFWENHSAQPRLRDKDKTLPLWLMTQLLAIARGVDAVHQPTSDEEPYLQLPGKVKPLYGRHGDLKPGNILCFKGKGDPFGNFQISDFGLAACHGTRSIQEIVGPQFGLSLCYRSPEIKVNGSVNPSYDVWPLGCVFLEFLGWYLLGWAHTDDFAGKRNRDSNGSEVQTYPGAENPPTDILFDDSFFDEEVKSVDGQIIRTARMKPSVIQELRLLRQDQSCSDLLLDVLDFIEDRMLRMNPNKRAQSHEIVEFFEKLVQICRDDPSYGIAKSKSPRRADTNLSEIDNRSMIEQPGGQLMIDQGIRSAAINMAAQSLEQDPVGVAGISATILLRNGAPSPEERKLNMPRSNFQPPELPDSPTFGTTDTSVWDERPISIHITQQTTPTPSQPDSVADSLADSFTSAELVTDETVLSSQPKPHNAMRSTRNGYGTMGAMKRTAPVEPPSHEHAPRFPWNRLFCC
ncbi:protein kinase domain-containing protein [Verticillium alfalfae VaMs.102]|uniref:Protein kinase domain-containing protein n=1 Tax=Verticillium alfalfae (strain VaMs.102 / ATCC MYA-4576 / FGSC 10136) TaxID=526221 RepID=C9SRT9_VERA1|nr:protein kinase domain-containing protein [Verticillium alfalfae VaMs.102]EEY21504.1 protein kinase domain-containing protein [Verticillium alfalfae VaMs.102]